MFEACRHFLYPPCRTRITQEFINTWLYYIIQRDESLERIGWYVSFIARPTVKVDSGFPVFRYRAVEKGRKHVKSSCWLPFFLRDRSVWRLVRKVNQGDAVATKNAAIQNSWPPYSCFMITEGEIPNMYSKFWFRIWHYDTTWETEIGYLSF